MESWVGQRITPDFLVKVTPHNLAVEAQRARRNKALLMLDHRARLWWVISTVLLPESFGEERNL
jgi:hypothetical protein